MTRRGDDEELSTCRPPWTPPWVAHAALISAAGRCRSNRQAMRQPSLEVAEAAAGEAEEVDLDELNSPCWDH